MHRMSDSVTLLPLSPRMQALATSQGLVRIEQFVGLKLDQVPQPDRAEFLRACAAYWDTAPRHEKAGGRPRVRA